jgi:ribosomal protein S25
MKDSAAGIGTQNESSLHRTLKHLYMQGGTTEYAVGKFVCDACTGDGTLIEIQTGTFAPLKKKLAALPLYTDIVIVRPIIIEKNIELYNSDGALISRRKSPAHGTVYDVFASLLYAPELALKPNISIEAPLVCVTETRVDDGKGSWRRRGVSIVDRRLESYKKGAVLSSRRDYKKLLGLKKDETFTVQAFAKQKKIRLSLAQKALYTLRKIGIVELAGKEGRRHLYKLKPAKHRGISV